MPLETKTSLNDETLEKLHELIRMNIDSHDGFMEAADAVKDTTLADLFRKLAADRHELSLRLKQFVEFNGEKPCKEGSYAAAVHRGWLKIRSMFSDGDAYAILCEAERGEDQIKNAYEEAIKDTAGSAMNDVLLMQYARVKAGHDQVRDLRDAYKQND